MIYKFTTATGAAGVKGRKTLELEAARSRLLAAREAISRPAARARPGLALSPSVALSDKK